VTDCHLGSISWISCRPKCVIFITCHKSCQVYFFNSRIKYTAKLHNTKLYSEIYTQQNYTIKSTTKYTEKSKKNLLIQSIDNLTENTQVCHKTFLMAPVLPLSVYRWFLFLRYKLICTSSATLHPQSCGFDRTLNIAEACIKY